MLNELLRKYGVKPAQLDAPPEEFRVALRSAQDLSLSAEERGYPGTFYVDGKPSSTKDLSPDFAWYARGTRGNPGVYWQTYISDPLVKSSVDGIHEGLVSGSWDVLAHPESADHDACVEQAAYLVKNLLSPASWKEFLRGWVYGDRVYGFSLWEIVDQPDGGIARLAYRRPGTVKKWVFDETGRDWVGCEFGYEGGRPDVFIERENLLLYTTGIDLDLEGVSALRPVVRWIEIKQLITQIETSAAESHGNGYRVVEATTDFFDASDMERLVEVIHAASAADNPVFAFPGYKMDWISPNGKLPDFESLRRYCDEQISLALQATGSLVGLGRTGTYNLAEVKDQQEQVRRTLYYGTAVCDLINEYIIPRIVENRWGIQQDHYPVLTFTLGQEADDPDRLNKIISAVQAGVITLTPDDVNKIRMELGLDPVAEKIVEENTLEDR